MSKYCRNYTKPELVHIIDFVERHGDFSMTQFYKALKHIFLARCIFLC
jgi:hypothetical protein